MGYTGYYLSAWQVEHRLINKTFSLIIFLCKERVGVGREKKREKGRKNRMR